MEKKYVILVGDGMGDYPLAELNGRTPLEAASTPHLDRLGSRGRLGMARTIPDCMEPGSDVANMSLLGYDPRSYHTGRAPLEAASMGIRLEERDLAFRCNLVNLRRDASGVMRMADYSAGHISTPESRELIAALQEATAGSVLRLYSGVSYRHLLVWPEGPQGLPTTPPHDITGEPSDPYGAVYLTDPVLTAFIRKAEQILAGHPVNISRQRDGKLTANSVWLWGQGRAPAMPTLKERFGLNGAMISAVDLLKGLGVYAGLEPIAVPGATGYLDTNYAGKVQAAIEALRRGQLVFIHVEAPDEASHEGSLEKKIRAIEDLDAKVVAPLVDGLREFAAVRMLIVTDHLTPIEKKTHVADPVPFLLVEDLNGGNAGSSDAPAFCERTARESGWRVGDGVDLFKIFIGT
ncbi:MAG TPA: cofactor-independent phosphoglycerate mutase [Syntrophobacter fumaroxidans]|nr:cofactor-independent phosphoglycerate mutase [Syntrophobacter fumaroxidans]